MITQLHFNLHFQKPSIMWCLSAFYLNLFQFSHCHSPPSDLFIHGLMCLLLSLLEYLFEKHLRNSLKMRMKFICQHPVLFQGLQNQTGSCLIIWWTWYFIDPRQRGWAEINYMVALIFQNLKI